MKRLRSYYERELASLHGFSREYAQQYPAQAEKLGMLVGGDSDRISSALSRPPPCPTRAPRS